MKIWALISYICQFVFPSEYQQDRTLLHCSMLLSENIPNIWRKSSTKHQGGQDQIETIKTIMQTTRPRITWKVLQWLKLPFLKKYSVKCEKDLNCELFYSELKRHNVSHYIYYLATDNIHRVRKR